MTKDKNDIRENLKEQECEYKEKKYDCKEESV